jgi:hypothetical protein
MKVSLFSRRMKDSSAQSWLKSYTKKNIAAAEEFADKLSQAKNLQDVVRIQTEFMQMQLSVFGEQAKSLGDTFTKVTKGVMQRPFQKS